jgi:hypothetical protein
MLAFFHVKTAWMPLIDSSVSTSAIHSILLPPDDFARLLRISPGGLLETDLDRDLTMKCLRPSLRDQTDHLIVDGDDPLLMKPGAH